jgi:ABC-type uncharacterized transport system permease subunit
MSDEQPTRPERDPYAEPGFDLRRGLKILLIVGVAVAIISGICITLDGRYS